MKKNYLHRICLAVVLMCSFSCSSDLDFDQANDLKSKPVIVGNLSQLQVFASDFIADDGSEKTFVLDDQNFDVFRDKYFTSYLQRADFFFETTNTIGRDYVLQIILLDQNEQRLLTVVLDVPTSTDENNTIKQTEIFENARLDLLKRARTMRFLITMKSAVARATGEGSITLRSSATVYLEIQ